MKTLSIEKMERVEGGTLVGSRYNTCYTPRLSFVWIGVAGLGIALLECATGTRFPF